MWHKKKKWHFSVTTLKFVLSCFPEIQCSVTIFTTLQAGPIDLLSQSVANNFAFLFLSHFVPPPSKNENLLAVWILITALCSFHPKCCQESPRREKGSSFPNRNYCSSENWVGEKKVCCQTGIREFVCILVVSPMDDRLSFHCMSFTLLKV